MNPGIRSRRLIDPLKLNRLFTAITKSTESDKEKEAVYKTVITGLVHDITGLDLLYTAAQEVLNGDVWAQNRLVAILNLLIALEPSTPGEPQPSPARPASRSKRRKSNPDGLPGSLSLPPYPPCFITLEEIVSIYFATFLVIPEESTGPVIQYLGRQLMKIEPLDLLYDLAEGVHTGEGVAIELFGSALEVVGMGRETLSLVKGLAVSGLSDFLAHSKSSTGGNPSAGTPMSGEIPRRLPKPYCVGIREDCTDEAVRAAREAQAERRSRLPVATLAIRLARSFSLEISKGLLASGQTLG